ncbi:MAG TPA: hypothetical protein VM580_16480, partial [Labilithrix sp.]|nr:hypothetical protein [Labilithrix sp.]
LGSVMSWSSRPLVNVRSHLTREGNITVARARQISAPPRGLPLLLIATVAGCSIAVTSSELETPPTVIQEKPPTLRQGGVVAREPAKVELPPARIVPVSEACRGEHLTLDAELSACACREREFSISNGGLAERAGYWCGLPHSNETTRANIGVSAERTVLAPGEGTNVVVRLTNSGPETSVYRILHRHISTDLVRADGRPLPDAALGWDGQYNEEALFELPPRGTMELRVPVSGTYWRWVGTGESSRTEKAKLSPGMYAIRVRLGELGGEGARLVPIEVR